MKRLVFFIAIPFISSFRYSNPVNYISIIHAGNNYAPIPKIMINEGSFVSSECGKTFVFCYSVTHKSYGDIENFIKKFKSDDTLDLSGNIAFITHDGKRDSSIYVLNRMHSKKALRDLMIFLKQRDCDQRISIRIQDLMERLGL